MNPAQISNLIPDIVAAREPSASDNWALVIIDDEIKCVTRENYQLEGTALMPITMKHINVGLSGREWDRVQNRIAAYQKIHPDFYAEPVLPAKETEAEPETEKTPEPANVDTDTDTQ